MSKKVVIWSSIFESKLKRVMQQMEQRRTLSRLQRQNGKLNNQSGNICTQRNGKRLSLASLDLFPSLFFSLSPFFSHFHFAICSIAKRTADVLPTEYLLYSSNLKYDTNFCFVSFVSLTHLSSRQEVVTLVKRKATWRRISTAPVSL